MLTSLMATQTGSIVDEAVVGGNLEKKEPIEMAQNVRVYGSNPRVIRPVDLIGKICPFCHRGNLLAAAKKDEVVIVDLNEEYVVHVECAEPFITRESKQHSWKVVPESPSPSKKPRVIKFDPGQIAARDAERDAELCCPMFGRERVEFNLTAFKTARPILDLDVMFIPGAGARLAREVFAEA